MKKVPVSKEAYEKLENAAKVEGSTPDKVAAEIIKEKSAEKSVFPAKSFVNAYGFVHLNNGVAKAFGIAKGQKTQVSIDFKEGNLIISKVA